MDNQTPEILLLQIRNLLARAKVSAVRTGFDHSDQYLIPDINSAIGAIDDFFQLEEKTQPAIELPFDADDYNGRGDLI